MKSIFKMVAISMFVCLISACDQKPETAFRKSIDLGYYEGMNIKWITDDSDNSATGFYIIDDVNIDKRQPNSKEFKTEKLIGHLGDLNIMWVSDNSDANSKGFYLFRNSDNQLVSSLSMGEYFSNGKNTVTRNVGAVFTSSMNKPNVQVSIGNNSNSETIKIDNLSSKELVQLSRKLLNMAQQKESEEKETNDRMK